MIIKDINILYKILDRKSIIDSIIDVTDISDVDGKEWIDLMDDLDQVEFIMNIEKKFNISIVDDLMEEIFSKPPSHLFNNIVSEKRERILNEIFKDVS